MKSPRSLSPLAAGLFCDEQQILSGNREILGALPNTRFAVNHPTPNPRGDKRYLPEIYVLDGNLLKKMSTKLQLLFSVGNQDSSFAENAAVVP